MTAMIIHDCRLKSEMKQLERARNRVKIDRARYFLRTIYPLFCIIFIILFWLLGLFHYWSHGSGSQEEDQAETSNHWLNTQPPSHSANNILSLATLFVQNIFWKSSVDISKHQVPRLNSCEEAPIKSCSDHNSLHLGYGDSLPRIVAVVAEHLDR